MDKERNVKRKVIKRNGSEVLFDWSKIEKAVSSAFAACNEKVDAKILDLIKAELSTTYKVKSDNISVETIQDTIEGVLMKSNYPQVAKAYILYREKHKELRLIKDRVDWIDNYMNSTENAASSSETDANANVTIKNVANIDGEVYKSFNRQIQRYRMTKKLEEMYPEVASQYVKDLEHHIIYTHDESSASSTKNYCEAVSLYPLLLEGTKNMDGLNTTPPKNLSSFCGQLVNLIFLLSAQCKGAVAVGELFNFFDYFCAKDFGENYHQTADRLEASVRPQRTIRQAIHQAYQQIVYGINQPAGNRSWQSPFTNISYYDSNYWHALFDDFCFPDGTKPVWERVDWLQRDFIHWFNEERTKTLLTFPVESMCLLSDSYDVVDKSYKELTAEMYSEGHSFFTYISDNPNSLSSCCRLRNEIAENVFSFTNGLSGVQTGSANVITLNLNRIVQDYCRETLAERQPFTSSETMYKGLSEYLTNILERVYKYHIAYKTLLYEVEEKGMLNASTAGYIKMSSLFSTIGINGLNEAAEFMGITCNYNLQYKQFCNVITSTINKQNKLHSNSKFKFNTELVPKSSGHFKPLLIDSKLLKGRRGASKETVQPERLNKEGFYL